MGKAPTGQNQVLHKTKGIIKVMKKYISFITALIVTFIPSIPVFISEKSGISAESVSPDSKNSKTIDEFYRVLDVSTGEIMEVSKKDYVIGAVCAEMPATFEEEALKAQAVTAHTYAERQCLREKENPTPELCGADFSNDTNKYQGYFTLNQAKQFYKDNFDIYYTKISEAVSEVWDYTIYYEDEPIVAAFHSMSNGKTESAENVWGSDVAYLQSVDSSQDTSAPKYLDEVEYEVDVVKNKLTQTYPNIVLDEDYTKWFEIKELSEAGTVLSIRVGDMEISGTDLRSVLLLRSASFEVKCEDNKITFTTKGYGHGVGMSQYGANAMAQEGKTWEQILAHYYPECTISK